jgi:citrate/tricarballylate utilization protein
MAPLDELVTEADRQFTICNACRYCEDYCPVFPAMELRTAFTAGDVSYLANLCHDCRACQQACMYTEPHEWALNLPALLTEARTESYARYARPAWAARAFDSGPLALALATLVAFAALLAGLLVAGRLDGLTLARSGPGSFYEVMSHWAMAAPALLLSAFAVAVAGGGFVAFWRDTGGTRAELMRLSTWRAALGQVAIMRGMRGGGGDCYYPDWERPSPVRRHMHQLVMYGFFATFAATIAAFVLEQWFGQLPPYPVLSVPVVLGLGGGIAATIGSIGLLWLKRTNTRELTTPRAVSLETSFLIALLSVSVTGLLLLAVRETSAMGITLVVHLATVFALYLTAPYGKFIHAVYRFGALLRAAHERG